ncbi:MAG: hypothetical protein IT350_05150 [Deltaproteobacteria bacterium]|nr:hypothetical protein [Deltaproteobacteria bacterium]
MTSIRRLGWVLALVFVFGVTGCTCGDDDDDNDSGDDDVAVDDDTDDDTADDDATDDDADDDDIGPYVVPPVNNPPPPYPEWVHRHWVWEDESTQQSALDHVQGYLDRDIPVGAVIIDSPWETGYNTFEWDETLFPDAQAMIDEFHDEGVRVFMWITPNVNVDSPNFQEGLDAGYYVKGGDTLEWWKGEGAYIDYWNPDALAWWHEQMDNVLDMGIDGWKTDGSEFTLILWPFIPTFDGPKTPKEYQDAYYRDFFNYSRERLGNDRVITARPVDSYALPWGPDFAPHDVSFAGWVGDQDPDWNGLDAAMRNMFMSGNRGHVNFGSDIAGYRGDDPREKDLYVRWMQFGAMSPIMENGGSGEHRPWMYDDEVLEIYRYFTELHHAILPYMYSQGAVSYATGLSNFRPFMRQQRSYTLGADIFVAPFTEAGGEKTVTFPEGTWIYWFTGAEYTGGTTEDLDLPLAEFPIFIRKGSIIPMAPPVGGLFDADALPRALTFYVYPDGEGSEFDLYEEDGPGARAEYTVTATGMTISISATARPVALRLHGDFAGEPVSVDPTGDLDAAADYDALVATETGAFYSEDDYALYIKPGAAADGLIVTIGNP